MKLHLVKSGNYLVPSLPYDEDQILKFKDGEILRVELTKPRNGKFHRKFFALLHVGFELWEPGEVDHKYGVPEKSFEQFREDVTILAGHYQTSVRVNGDVRVVAKSISFARMAQEDFESLYDNVIDVLLGKVLRNYTREELDDQVDRIMRFT